MDLSLVPIQELYEEIAGRFDIAVFAGKKIGGKDSMISRRYKGDHHAAMGLCDDLIHSINREIIDGETPLSPEDL